MNYDVLKIERLDKTAIIKLNRPDKLNAINSLLLNELEKIFNELKSDNGIKSILLTGEGEKAFAAGADIKELSDLNIVEAKSYSEKGHRIFSMIENFPKPVLCAVNGFALGGGFELALACHIRVCSDNAKFGLPELNLGLIPGYGGTQRLTTLINSGRAAYYILTGENITSEEALKLGIVIKIFPQKDLLNNSLKILEKINLKSKISIQFALKAIKSSSGLYENGLNLESTLFALCFGSNDFHEGTKAFLEKRYPNFKDS